MLDQTKLVSAIPKYHKSTDLLGRILFVNSDNELEELMLIEYRDLLAGSQYSTTSTVIESQSFGECELNFNNEDKFKEIAKKMESYPLCFEVFIYDNYESLADDEYNLFYFLDYNYFNEEVQTEAREMTIKGYGYEKQIEHGSVADHNIELYTSLEQNESGEYIKPPNFNMLYFPNYQFWDIYLYVLQYNVLQPKFLEHGFEHGTSIDSGRIPRGFDDSYNDNVSYPIDDYIEVYSSEKKSVYDVKREVWQIATAQNGIANLPTTKLRIVNNKFRIYMFLEEEIDLDLLISLDRIITKQRERDFASSVETAFVESSETDFAQANNTVLDTGSFWKKKERVESTSPDKGTEEFPNDIYSSEYLLPLQAKSFEILGENSPVLSSELEIDFKTKTYFKDLNVHQIVNVTNAGELFDGQYRIDKISAVIEQTYTSYSLEELRKVEDVLSEKEIKDGIHK